MSCFFLTWVLGKQTQALMLTTQAISPAQRLLPKTALTLSPCWGVSASFPHITDLNITAWQRFLSWLPESRSCLVACGLSRYLPGCSCLGAFVSHCETVLVVWVPGRAEVPGEWGPALVAVLTLYSGKSCLCPGKDVHGQLGALQSSTVDPSVATPCTCLGISVCVFQLWLHTSQGSRERNVNFMNLIRYYWLKEEYA